MKASDVKKYNVFSSLCLIFRGREAHSGLSVHFTDNKCEFAKYPPNSGGGGSNDRCMKEGDANS